MTQPPLPPSPTQLRRLAHAGLFAALTLLAACDKEAGITQDGRETATGELPVLTQVPAFSLTNQQGLSFGSEQLRGKEYIAAFMFTRCPSICPRLTARMKSIDETFRERGVPLQLISFSVDPEYDTPKALQAYAEKHKLNLMRWNFLTGEHAAIARTAEQGFKVGLSGKVDESKAHLGITHASHLILVDSEANIRGYYSVDDADVVQKLLNAVIELQK